MMLRSSSTPLLGSLISSSSNNNPHSHHHNQTFISVSCNFSSPFSDVNSDTVIHRASSVDSLHSLPCTAASRNTYSPNKDNDIIEEDEGFGLSTPKTMFMARGLGIDGMCGGGGGGNCVVKRTGNEGEQSDIESYYKQMVEENPNNALILRNYAQFLYQSKGDSRRAEEYYSRAIIADPADGDILSQYAMLIWEKNRDEERASCYFQQAVQAAPDNSHVLAAYAGFLWETEDDANEDIDAGIESAQLHDIRHNGAMASVAA